MVIDLTRREFLMLVAAGTLVVPDIHQRHDHWHSLLNEDGQTLLAVARTLFPLAGSKETVYVPVVANIFLKCDADEEVRNFIAAGIATLRGSSFASESHAVRVRLLHAARSSDFFRVVYAASLESLYGPSGVWTATR